MLFSLCRSRIFSPQFAHSNQCGLQYRKVVGSQGGIQFMGDFVNHGRKIGNGIGRTRVLPNIPINDLGKPTNSLVHLSIPRFLRQRSRAAHLSSSWHERAKSALGLLLAAEARRSQELGRGAPRGFRPARFSVPKSPPHFGDTARCCPPSWRAIVPLF